MGHPTIGIGFNLDRADAPTLIANGVWNSKRLFSRFLSNILVIHFFLSFSLSLISLPIPPTATTATTNQSALITRRCAPARSA